MSNFTIMQINTQKLFPVGKIKVNLCELTTVDSLKMTTIDTTILKEKLQHKNSNLLSDGDKFYIVREDILVQISHPSFKNQ